MCYSLLDSADFVTVRALDMLLTQGAIMGKWSKISHPNIARANGKI